MAAPKLSPAQWAKVRSHWEMDSRGGFTWIVKELSLPVSAPGVRKKADKESWAKAENAGETVAKPLIVKAKAEKPKKPEIQKAAKPEASIKSAKPEKPETNALEELTPYKTRETPLLDELDRDYPQQGLFVREYVKDLNATQAAIRAGYCRNTADVQGSRLLASDRIQSCIRELRDELLSRIEASAEGVIRVLVNQLHADINEISQFRRVCCRSCYGEGFAYQCTPLEFQAKRMKHDKERAKALKDSEGAVDIGEFPSYEQDWYDKRREPNAECPECFGEGLGEVYFGDTRKLSQAAKSMYGGVKQTKDGIEIIVANREKVIDQLARVLGMFRDAETTVNVNVMAPDALTKLYWDRMSAARARQQRVDAERGNIIDVEPVIGVPETGGEG